jgi:hypothetical protein
MGQKQQQTPDLEQVLLSRGSPPRDPKPRNDNAGDADRAVQQDDYILHFLINQFLHPDTAPDGSRPPAQIPDNIQEIFDRTRNGELGKMLRPAAPMNWGNERILPPEGKQ